MVREITLRTHGGMYLFLRNVGIISALVCFFVGDVDDRDVLGVQNPKNVNGLECLYKIVLWLIEVQNKVLHWSTRTVHETCLVDAI